MPKRVFIIHGWNGNPAGGWKPWLCAQLEPRGFQVSVPAMPSPALPKCAQWVEKIRQSVTTPDAACYFVGHSLGAPALLRYFESLPVGTRVGGAVLVAGLAQIHRYPLFQSFFAKPFDWERIRGVCPKFVAIRSDNDLLVPPSHAELYWKNLGAKVVVVPGKGHFSGDEGITELPQALEAVLEIARGR